MNYNECLTKQKNSLKQKQFLFLLLTTDDKLKNNIYQEKKRGLNISSKRMILKFMCSENDEEQVSIRNKMLSKLNM